jgi:ABC-type cobalamin transport system permease subunit
MAPTVKVTIRQEVFVCVCVCVYIYICAQEIKPIPTCGVLGFSNCWLKPDDSWSKEEEEISFEIKIDGLVRIMPSEYL